MWIVFGNTMKTERVPGGRKVERTCTKCGETAMFYEREATKSFQLYFIDVFDYRTQRVMACGACGALYATDELGAPTERLATPTVEPGKLVESLVDAAQRAGQAIQQGATRAVGALTAEFGERAKPPAPQRPQDPPAPSDDPLADEDAALLARFEELEKRPKPPRE